MKFVFLEVSPSNEAWALQAQSVYVEKLKHFVPFEVLTLQSKKAARGESAQKLQVETKAMLDAIKPDDFVVLFDERGKSLNSPQFAQNLERILNSGKKRCVWIIGGAYGVGEEVKARADAKLAIAPFVLNHLVAKTVALEQVYRGFTILKNLPYHNS